MEILKNSINRMLNQKVLLFSLITIVFTLGFYINFWGTVEQARFDSFDLCGKSLVVGRLVKAEKEGVFSQGGFNGWIVDGPEKKLNRPQLYYYQFEIYENELDIDASKFNPYVTQIGGQAILFAFLDRISPFSNSTNLNLFFLLTSISLAVVLALFVYWVHNNFITIKHGRIAALITSFFIVISPWLTLFGNGFYWVLAVFYLPFVVILLSLQKEYLKKEELSLRRIFIITICLVFVKLLFSGFEYITTALIMFTIPLFYYSFLNKWKFKFFLKRFITISTAAISAIFLYVIVFAFQYKSISGSFLDGLEHLIYSFYKRTSGYSADLPEIYKNSLESSIAEVLKIYWNKTAIDLNIWFNSDMVSFFTIDFGELFLIFLIFSALCYISKDSSPSIYKNRKENKALMFVTWFSMLAPLSWFVIFKGHSYIHGHLNPIVWYMPFCLFGFVLIGSIVSSLVKDTYTLYLKNRIKHIKRIISISAIVFVLSILILKMLNGAEEYKEFKSITRTENFLCEANGFNIYLHDQKLVYVKEKPTLWDRNACFFVHITPCDVSVLSEKRKKHGFDNLDFYVNNKNSITLPFWSGERESLIIYKKLKGYEIKNITTGQFNESGRIWSAKSIYKK